MWSFGAATGSVNVILSDGFALLRFSASVLDAVTLDAALLSVFV
jgi:hypothetical protein